MTDHRCTLPPAAQVALLDLAREAIRFGLHNGSPPPVTLSVLPPELAERRASFVTLLKRGALRGCIGSLEATRPLAVDVARNAFAAAFRDPRFPPVAADELDLIEIHLSLLTPAEPMAITSEADLITQLRSGVDGLILQEGSRRATFLPSVWESLPDPREFVRHLKYKAGLPADYWSNAVQASRYRAEHVS